MVLDCIVIVLFAIGMIAIAVVTRKRSKSVDDFLLGGKKGLNGWLTAFAYGTTYFSAVIFVGYAGQYGRQYGLASIWIGVGNAIIGTLFAWLVLAKRTRNMTKRLEAKTMPEFFEKRYGSTKLKFVSAIIIFIFLIPYSASVYNGLSSLFEIVFNVDGWIVMLCLAIITALYLFFGGYFATAVSDFIQGLIMIVGVIVMFFFFMNSKEVSWDISSITENPHLTWTTFGVSQGDKWLYGPTVTLLSLILLTSLGVWALPQTIHKYYAIRDKKSITQGVVISSLFAIIIGVIAYFIGSLSELFLGHEVISDATASGNYGAIIPNMLELVIPAGVMGLIAVLILSASMSTLSSVSLASASVIANDLYKGIVKEKTNDKRQTIIMRVLCLVFIGISVTIAILNEKFKLAAIAYLMGISWGTLAGCFIGPYVLGVIWKKVTRPAVWTSIISALVLTVTLILVLGADKSGWSGSFSVILKNGVSCSPLIGVICMIFSLIITYVVSLFTKAPTQDIIENSFNKPIEDEIK